MTELTLYDFSNERADHPFDPLDLNKPIQDLTESDLLWCMRKRLFLEQVLDLVLIKIEREWDKINKGYKVAIGEWYKEIVIQLVTFPYAFWETKHRKLEKFQRFIKNSEQVTFTIETELIERFLALKPTLFVWTNEKSTEFQSNLAYGLLGNVLLAFRQMSRIKYALLNGQAVFIEQIYQSISTEEELLTFIESECDLGDYLDDLLEFLNKENTIVKHV